MSPNYKPYVLWTIWTDSGGNLCPSELSLKYKHMSWFPVKTMLSFDILDNKDFYSTDSIFVAILIAHCLVDKLLFELLKLSLIDKSLIKKLEKDEITFYEKIKLCHRMSIISKTTSDVLKVFNKLRNSIAHKYDNYNYLVKNTRFSSFEKELVRLQVLDFEWKQHLQTYFNKLVSEEKILRKEKYILLDFIQTVWIESLGNIFRANEDKVFIEPNN